MSRILCIEDDAAIQHLLGEVLFRENYEVFYAWNGQEGYEKILSLSPDLVILDLMLPVMNGIDLLTKLRECPAGRGLPVIVVTAFGDDADMLKCAVEALGAAAYIRKPLELREFLRVVKQTLARRPPGAQARAAAPAAVLRKGVVRADPANRSVWIDDRLTATLSAKEFSLLERLLRSPGPVRKDALLRDLGYAPAQGNALKQIVHRLRSALGATGAWRVKAAGDGYELDG